MHSLHAPVRSFAINEFGNGVLVLAVGDLPARPLHYYNAEVNGVPCVVLEHSESHVMAVIDENLLAMFNAVEVDTVVLLTFDVAD